MENIKHVSLYTKEVEKTLWKRKKKVCKKKLHGKLLLLQILACNIWNPCLQYFTNTENRNAFQPVGCKVIITGEILRPGRKNTKTEAMTSCRKYCLLFPLPLLFSWFLNVFEAKYRSATALPLWHSCCSSFKGFLNVQIWTTYAFFHVTVWRKFQLKEIPSIWEHDNVWKDTDNTDNVISELNYLTHSLYCAKH